MLSQGRYSGPTSEGCEVHSKYDDDNNNNDKTMAGPKVVAHVDLNKTVCELALSLLLKYF